MACLETLAASIKRLQDENIPIILRPLHEAEGAAVKKDHGSGGASRVLLFIRNCGSLHIKP